MKRKSMWKNVGKENLKKTSLPLIVIDQRQQKNLEYFNNSGSMILSDARRTRETKSRNDMAKSTFNKRKNLFTSKLDSS
jgi:hypothetical protein